MCRTSRIGTRKVAVGPCSVELLPVLTAPAKMSWVVPAEALRDAEALEEPSGGISQAQAVRCSGRMKQIPAKADSKQSKAAEGSE